MVYLVYLKLAITCNQMNMLLVFASSAYNFGLTCGSKYGTHHAGPRNPVDEQANAQSSLRHSGHSTILDNGHMEMALDLEGHW